MASVQLFHGAVIVPAGGTSIIALYGPMLGGIIANPASATAQNIATAEALYVSLVGPATIGASVTFSAIVTQPQAQPPNAQAVFAFPPNGPVTVQNTIPSYLYVQYNDDDNLQAFVSSFNALAKEYVDWFNQTPLAVYTEDVIAGALLDWIAYGLYGMQRPSLSVTSPTPLGPFNTYQTNQIPFNYYTTVGGGTFQPTSDDTFKRILTWHLFKGDGKIFNIRFLKRRIARFLTGANGAAGTTDQTYDISVTFGSGTTVNINVGSYAQILQQAVASGVLELPFQFDFVVNLP